MTSEQVSPKSSRNITVPLMLVTIIALTACAIMFYKYHQPQNTDQAQQKRLVANLATVIDLPSGTPTVVTVADKSKLTNKTLANRVNNKDLLLIYGSSKRIIVYRPSNQKVIDMLSFEAQMPSTQQTTGSDKPKP